MAQFHFKMQKPAQRSQGRSAVAMAAYRSAERLTDERLGNVHDFERRGGVIHSEIVTPEGMEVESADDRGTFWNQVEASETRKNSQVARELIIGMPHELDADARQGIALEMGHYMADRYGIGVDVSIHDPSEKGDDRNFHAHLMMTTRQLDPDSDSGFGAKVRTLDGISERQAGREGDEIEHLREVWERLQNDELRRLDIRDERGELVQVDRRSYERQGIDREATEHEGVEATQIRRQGGQTEIGQENDAKQQRNAEREELEQQIDGSREAIADELKAIHRTPDEDKIKYAFHDDDTVQDIFDDLDREGQGYSYLGGGRLVPHLFRAGHSRRLAEFNAELEADREPGGEDQRGQWRNAQRDVDQAERRGDGWNDFLQELADASQQRQAEKQRGSDRQFPTESDLLDTDPRPGEFAQTVTPDPEPDERRGFGRGGW